MQVEKFAALVDAAKKILIVFHVNPDGDAIGSALALKRMCEKKNKEVTVYCKDTVPWNLKFLNGSEKIVSTLEGEFDLTIILDCGSASRVGNTFEEFEGKGKVVVIDHHIDNDQKAELKIIDQKAAAVGDLLFRLFNELGWKMDAEVAQALFCGIVTDTAFFRYSNVSAGLFERTAELVKLGASPWEVAKHMEDEYPLSRFKLVALAMNSMETFLGGKFCSMFVTEKMFKEAGATMEQSEDFSEIPRSVENVEVSALFREKSKNVIRVSLRSKDYVNVSDLAKKFDGGGHARAAGCTIEDTIDNARKFIIEAVKGSFQ
ncbi:MAG: bifunctional oligoribonuclease/PAP phosphatase NrnA [Pseudomonadota bacterium]